MTSAGWERTAKAAKLKAPNGEYSPFAENGLTPEVLEIADVLEPEQALSKVPSATLVFSVIKILATTLSERAGMP